MNEQELAYGQQKNREHLWDSAIERWEFNHNCKYVSWRDEDSAMLNLIYEALCEEVGITPW